MSEQVFTIGGLGPNLLWNLLTAYLQIFELCPFEYVLLFIGVRDGSQQSFSNDLYLK